QLAWNDGPQARKPREATIIPADPWAPSTWWRPWLLVAGVMLGLACSVKWSGAYALAVFGLLVFAWGAAVRKAVGVRLWFGAGVFREGVPAFFQLVPTAILTYVVAFMPWFLHPVGWDRQWAPDQQARNAELPPADQIPMPIDGAPDLVNSFIHWHQASMEFHTGLSEPHSYQSQAWQWLPQLRPVSFFWDGNDELPAGSCPSDDCVAAITSLGNPFIWWLALLALIIVVIAAIKRRDWRAWAIIAGYLAMWAPWLMYTDRTIFQFYAIAFLPYVVLALVYGLAWLTDMLGPRPPEPRTHRVQIDDDGAACATSLAEDDLVVLGSSKDGTPAALAANGVHATRSSIMLDHADIKVPNRASKVLLGFVVATILAASLFWYPIWTAIPVPRWFWQLHMWLPTWI
ncbi:dolichyl-phosphate-mannose--protein mannosyltransferase, partial [Trueperella sp.]|uniref:dolichyl-phosphate-mannose--protein mannosyltransferase n=1 Tax=Trueperella sp. TaxID=2699835 RepID=UPI0037351727